MLVIFIPRYKGSSDHLLITVMPVKKYQPVECRMLRTEGITIVSSFNLKLFFRRAVNKTAAAVFPISKAGCVIVVSVGVRIRAACRLVKVITFILSGMESFRSVQAR